MENKTKTYILVVSYDENGRTSLKHHDHEVVIITVNYLCDAFAYFIDEFVEWIRLHNAININCHQTEEVDGKVTATYNKKTGEIEAEYV